MLSHIRIFTRLFLVLYQPERCCCCSHESIVVDGLWKGLVKPFSPMLLGKFYVHINMTRRSTENYSLLP